MIETWRPIPGHEGRYEVSDFGMVRSLARTCRSRHKRGYRAVPAKMLKLSWSGKPGQKRIRVVLFRGATRREAWFVHRLVLLAFKGPCPEGMEGCHNDNDPGNNCLDNLRYDTRSGNFSDKPKHGTHQRGERHGLAKLSNSQALEIFQAKGKLRAPGLATRYGVSEASVYSIWSGQSWGHITGLAHATHPLQQ